ncbi:NDxxF motif lipoprotein [Alkalihalobacillus sp. NPDC078783]
MKKYAAILLLSSIYLLNGCSSEESIENDEEISKIEDIQIPTIFTSEKSGYDINKDEMKSSIQSYLDSSEDLFNAMLIYEENMYEDIEFTEDDIEKLNILSELTTENDDNFYDFITTNTVPKDYEVDVLRISLYITSLNEFVESLDENLSTFEENIVNGKITKKNISSILNTNGVVNGREQKKIEDFLDTENIDTKAFSK